MSSKAQKRKRDASRWVSTDSLRQRGSCVTSTSSRSRVQQVQTHIPNPPTRATTQPDNANANPGVFMECPDEDMVSLPPDEEPGRVKMKAKRYEDSDAPLLTWKAEHREQYLLWSYASEGRGRLHRGGCSFCCSSSADYRCLDCSGYHMVCRDCLINTHTYLPFHRVQQWKNDFFHPISLREVGVRVRLGHCRGESCNTPASSSHDFVVIDVNGIHLVHLIFCGCSSVDPVYQLLEFGLWPSSYKDPCSAATFAVLRLFHRVNLAANTTQTDFYRALERMTDGQGLTPPPASITMILCLFYTHINFQDRLAQFKLMVREWRHIKLGRRAGRGHDPTGLAGTANGSAAVLCRACPHPGINLPDGWEQAPLSDQWLYTLLVSIDANFKQKNRVRPNDKNDPPLAGGWGTFVPNEPYMQEVNNHTNQDEISHCVGFAAIWSANTKKSKGLRATGVGAVFCSRHGLFRPNGMGDLQKGERYINMDCILLMTLIGCVLTRLVITYDIACQWNINFFERMKRLPKAWQFPPSRTVTFRVPKFHLPAHIEKCHALYALEYTEGVGDVDGESPERNWSVFNENASSFSVMTSGARSDAADDHCNHTNFEKTVKLADSLLKKLIKGISNLVIYTRSFSAFSDALKDNHADDMALWEQHVIDWERGIRKDCPYEMPTSSITMAKVKKALADEEQQRSKKSDGDTALTLSEMLIEGLAVEDTQRTLSAIASQSELTLYQETDLQNRRTALWKRIRRFRENQVTHMPGLEKYVNLPSTDVEVEKILLLLPSSFDHSTRGKICSDDAISIESRLREAQCVEALSTLRGLLRARTLTYKTSTQSGTSQRMFTKLNTLRTQLEVRVSAAAGMYNTARAALLEFRGPGEWEKILRELKKEDLRGIGERVMKENEEADFRTAQERAGVDAKAIERMLHGKAVTLPTIFVDPTLPCDPGKRDTISWIWYTFALDEVSDHNVQEVEGASNQEIKASLRVEWLKARARARRSREEVVLVEEEMRRAIEFCKWRSKWWEKQISLHDGLESWIKEGLTAYALEQASAESLRAYLWYTRLHPIRERAKAIRMWIDDPKKDLEVLLRKLTVIEIEVDLDEEDV